MARLVPLSIQAFLPVLEACCNFKAGRPFPAKFSGNCALTGLPFYAGSLIRTVPTSDGIKYVSQQRFSDICINDNFEAMSKVKSPYSFKVLTSWMDDPKTKKIVLMSTSSEKYYYRKHGEWRTGDYGGSPVGSKKQIAARTKHVLFMTRLCEV